MGKEVTRMVRAVENWTLLTGRVRGLREIRDGVSHVIMVVTRADEVQGFPNLLADAPGSELVVSLKSAAIERVGLQVGDAISVRAQRSGPRSVVGQPASLARPPKAP